MYSVSGWRERTRYRNVLFYDDWRKRSHHKYFSKKCQKAKKIFHIFDFPFAYVQIFSLIVYYINYFKFRFTIFLSYQKSIFHATLRIAIVLSFYLERKFLYSLYYIFDRYKLIAESLSIQYFDRRISRIALAPGGSEFFRQREIPRCSHDFLMSPPAQWRRLQN